MLTRRAFIAGSTATFVGVGTAYAVPTGKQVGKPPPKPTTTTTTTRAGVSLPILDENNQPILDEFGNQIFDEGH